MQKPQKEPAKAEQDGCIKNTFAIGVLLYLSFATCAALSNGSGGLGFVLLYFIIIALILKWRWKQWAS